MSSNMNNTTIIVRVERPNLTPEERVKRMEHIKQAAANLVLAARKTTT